jgi:hypothetical protein
MKWKNRLVLGVAGALVSYEAWSQWTSGRVRIAMGSNLIKLVLNRESSPVGFWVILSMTCILAAFFLYAALSPRKTDSLDEG